MYGGDVSATALGCDSVFTTGIGDAGVGRYPCLCDKGIFWIIAFVAVVGYKEKSDLSARPSTIETRGEPSS